MFCTISLDAKKRKFHKSFKIESIDIGNDYFIKVTCYKIPDFKKIERRLKGKADFAVISEKIENKHFKNIPTFNCENYLNGVAFYTFKKVLSLIPKNHKQVCVCLVDREAKYTSLVFSIAKHSSVIKIVTKEYDTYSNVSKELYDQKGFFPVISDEITEFDLLFDFEEVPKIIFNNKQTTAYITKNCVKIGSALSRFVPKGIGECEFAGALSEYRNYRRLKLIDSPVFMIDGKYFTVNAQNVENFLDNCV